MRSSSAPDVLVVDDEPQYRRLASVNVRLAGFEVREAANGMETIRAVKTRLPDLIILDLLLPDWHGFEVLARVRKLGECPVIIVSALDAKPDVVAGLNHGADDYLVKPYSVDELLARIRAVLRRGVPAAGPAEEVLAFGVVRLDPRDRTLDGPRGLRRLTPTEWNLMVELVRNGGTVLTHDHLLSRVWGPEYRGEETYLRVYMRRLRTYIEPDPAAPHYLVTYPGVGYALMDGLRDGA